jgi:hypothetical protein
MNADNQPATLFMSKFPLHSWDLSSKLLIHVSRSTEKEVCETSHPKDGM